MLTKTNMMPTQSVADVIEITTPNNDAMKVKLISLAAKVNLGKTKFGEKKCLKKKLRKKFFFLIFF